MAGTSITLDQALDLTRTGDIWLFRGRSIADRAIRVTTNSPVNHVGMSVVLDDLPPLMWHAELGRSLPDLWSGAHQRGVQLHDLRAAVLVWCTKYGQQGWLRQLDQPATRAMEDAMLRTIARLDGTPFPSTTRLATRWLWGRVPPARGRATELIGRMPHLVDRLPDFADRLPRLADRLPHLVDRLPQLVRRFPHLDGSPPEFPRGRGRSSRFVDRLRHGPEPLPDGRDPMAQHRKERAARRGQSPAGDDRADEPTGAGSRDQREATTPGMRLETAYCAEVIAVTYEAMGLLPTGRRSSWYDAGRFWSGDDLRLTGDARLRGEIAIEVPGADTLA